MIKNTCLKELNNITKTVFVNVLMTSGVVAEVKPSVHSLINDHNLAIQEFRPFTLRQFIT